MMVDHYEINVSLCMTGQHYMRVKLPTGLTEKQAKARMKLLRVSLNADLDCPMFEFTLHAHHFANIHEIEC